MFLLLARVDVSRRGWTTVRHERIMSFVLVTCKPNTFCFCCLSALLRHHQGLFSFLFFSFLGWALRAITKASRPGLACIICVEFLISGPSVREQSPRMASAQQSGPRWVFFQQTQTFFFFFFFTSNLAEKECSICTSGPENCTKADYQLFLSILLKNVSPYLPSLAFLFLTGIIVNYRTASSTSSPVLPSLSHPHPPHPQCPALFLCSGS